MGKVEVCIQEEGRSCRQDGETCTMTSGGGNLPEKEKSWLTLTCSPELLETKSKINRALVDNEILTIIGKLAEQIILRDETCAVEVVGACNGL